MADSGHQPNQTEAAYAEVERWRDSRYTTLSERYRLDLIESLLALLESRDQRIKELRVALQDLYDWGPGENATPAAKQSWEEAYTVLLDITRAPQQEAAPDVADTAWAIIAHHRKHRTAG